MNAIFEVVAIVLIFIMFMILVLTLGGYFNDKK